MRSAGIFNAWEHDFPVALWPDQPAHVWLRPRPRTRAALLASGTRCRVQACGWSASCPRRSLETHRPRGPPETHCRPVSAPVAGAVRGPSLSRLGWTKAVASSLVRASMRRRLRGRRTRWNCADRASTPQMKASERIQKGHLRWKYDTYTCVDGTQVRYKL